MRNNAEQWSSRQTLMTLSLAAVTVLLLYISGLFAWPFFPALTWALTLAVVLDPFYERLPFVKRYPNLTAIIAVTVVGLFVIGPLVGLGFYVAAQVPEALKMLRDQINSGQFEAVLDRYPLLDELVDHLKQQADGQQSMQGGMETIGKVFMGLVGGPVWVAVQILIMLFALFYFLRDRRSIVRWVKESVPLTSEETAFVFDRVQDTMQATVVGTLVISLLKGLQWGPIMWLLGAPVPVLWGTLMGVSSVIPYLGSPIVGLLSAAVLLVTGSWVKALIAVVWGMVVIGLIDTLLYPVFVGHRLTLHPVAVFFAFLGGVVLFGVSGLVLGPLLLALSWAALEIWRERTERGRAATEAVRKEAG